MSVEWAPDYSTFIDRDKYPSAVYQYPDPGGGSEGAYPTPGGFYYPNYWDEGFIHGAIITPFSNGTSVRPTYYDLVAAGQWTLTDPNSPAWSYLNTLAGNFGDVKSSGMALLWALNGAQALIIVRDRPDLIELSVKQALAGLNPGFVDSFAAACGRWYTQYWNANPANDGFSFRNVVNDMAQSGRELGSFIVQFVAMAVLAYTGAAAAGAAAAGSAAAAGATAEGATAIEAGGATLVDAPVFEVAPELVAAPEIAPVLEAPVLDLAPELATAEIAPVDFTAPEIAPVLEEPAVFELDAPTFQLPTSSDILPEFIEPVSADIAPPDIADVLPEELPSELPEISPEQIDNVLQEEFPEELPEETSAPRRPTLDDIKRAVNLTRRLALPSTQPRPRRAPVTLPATAEPTAAPKAQKSAPLLETEKWDIVKLLTVGATIWSIFR